MLMMTTWLSSVFARQSMITGMQRTVAFDVYGTLIDPLGISETLSAFVGAIAPAAAAAWRSKQLEYLFRRGLGRKYQPFSVCTRQALDYVCLARGLAIDEGDRDFLMRAYRELPAYPGAGAVLQALRNADCRCYAFSNGGPGELRQLLANAGLDRSLDGIVSVEDVRSFKPDPAVYAHFLENTGALLGRTWLVSGNPFDVIGALEVGWRAIWVRRDMQQVFDPWGITPTATVSRLEELLGLLGAA